MSRVLLTGDFHFGAGASLTADRLHEQEQGLERIVDLAIAENVAAVLIGGDLFEGPLPTPEHYMAVARPLRRLAEATDVYAVLGNGRHDSAMRHQNALEILNAGYSDSHRLFTVSTTPELWRLPGLTVATLPWTPTSRLVAARNGGDRGEINAAAADLLIETARGLREQIDGPAVLLGHWSVSGAALPNGLPVDALHEPVLPLAEIEALGFDAAVFAHIHKAQLLSAGPIAPDQNGSSRTVASAPILYVGSPMVLNWGESEMAHGVWVLDTETWQADFHAVADRRFVTVNVNLGDGYKEGSETDAVEAAIGLEGGDLDGAVLRVRAGGTADQIRRVDRQAIQALCDDAGVRRLTFVPVPVRVDRARVAGVTDQLSPSQMLDLYIDHQGIGERLAEGMRETTAGFLQEVAGVGGRLTGGGYRPYRIVLSHVGPFEQVDVELPLGPAEILGPNGAGKSTLVNALVTGPFAERGELAGLLSNGADALELTVYFESGGEEFRVRRSYSGRGRGTAKLDFERWEGATA